VPGASGRGLRALWVTAEPPDRNLGGGSIREAYLLEALGRRVPTELVLTGRLEDPATREALVRVTELPLPRPRRRAGPVRRRAGALVRALVTRTTAPVAENRPHRRELARFLAANASRFELVVVEHDRLAPLAPPRSARRGRWALTLHNLQSEQLSHTLAITTGRRQRWLCERERVVALRFEARVSTAYDLVVVTSADDAAALPVPALVVPNGVDLERFRPAPLPAEPRLVFTGMLQWRPNVEGLAWFAAEVLPLVRRTVPEATLSVVGRMPVPEVERLGRLPGVALHADVPSTVPFLHEARVAIVPVRIGSGTRIKALEAMAAGRPVVGTTVGLAGLGVVPGRHALVADDPSAFAEAVVALLADDGLATRLAAAGRELAERFSWGAIGERFVDRLLEGL
jgi:glycosyltransferase involved in cell wall biosynthesis